MPVYYPSDILILAFNRERAVSTEEGIRASKRSENSISTK
jgi:hypothetical protein